MHQDLQRGIFIALASTLAVCFAIYLTPLKWLNVFPPVITDVDPKEFYEKFNQNPDDYIFIDVRGEDVYNTKHAAGSINMPIGTLYDGHRLLPKKGKTIVLICSSGRLAGVAYHYLEHQGFLNLERIEGGVHAWASAGLPVAGRNIHADVPTRD